jgi:hypothetical protein
MTSVINLWKFIADIIAASYHGNYRFVSGQYMTPGLWWVLSWKIFPQIQLISFSIIIQFYWKALALAVATLAMALQAILAPTIFKWQFIVAVSKTHLPSNYAQVVYYLLQNAMLLSAMYTNEHLNDISHHLEEIL